jgi:hypothetical protein
MLTNIRYINAFILHSYKKHPEYWALYSTPMAYHRCLHHTLSGCNGRSSSTWILSVSCCHLTLSLRSLGFKQLWVAYVWSHFRFLFSAVDVMVQGFALLCNHVSCMLQTCCVTTCSLSVFLHMILACLNVPMAFLLPAYACGQFSLARPAGV